MAMVAGGMAFLSKYNQNTANLQIRYPQMFEQSMPAAVITWS